MCYAQRVAGESPAVNIQRPACLVLSAVWSRRAPSGSSLIGKAEEYLLCEI